MQSSSKWLSGIGAVGLMLGSLGLAGCGSSDDSAIAQGVPADLSGVTQNWDKNLQAAQRFVVLAAFGNAAVRDNETGLVWEQAPAITLHQWSIARFQCTSRTTGNRRGWRLPSIHELSSLIDPTVAIPGPTLPAGHPFTIVQSANFWSATPDADGPSLAWFVSFGSGTVINGGNKNGSVGAWCVRGGMNAEAY